LYIHHAKNIVMGKNYSDTGYIFNPLNPSLSPKTYPPFFPVLLTPIYYFYGLNFHIMKLEIIFFFLLFLYSVYFYFRDYIDTEFSVLLIFLIGFNYWFWDFKDRILSDIPFAFLTFLSLSLLIKVYQKSGNNRKVLSLSTLTGFLIYLCFTTRTIGFVLIPVVITYDFITEKNITTKTMIISIIFILLYSFQLLVLPNDLSYFKQFNFCFDTIINHIVYYALTLAFFWRNGYFKLLTYAVFLLFSIAALIGYFLKIKRGFCFSEIFIIYYILLILMWPAPLGLRGLIPIIPFYIFYGIYFMNYCKNYYHKKNLFWAAFIIFNLILSGSYIMQYKINGFAPIKKGIHNLESIELFNFIRSETQKSDIIIFFKPRVLALFTDRPSSCYPLIVKEDEFLDYLKSIKANYLIENINYKPNQTLSKFIKQNKNKFKLVFYNNDFRVFKIIDF